MSDELYKDYEKEIEILRMLANNQEDENIRIMFSGMAKFMKLILNLRVDMLEIRGSVTDIEKRLNKLDGGFGV